MASSVNARLDRLFEAVVAKTDLILLAHSELGIPLEDLICAAVRRAASLKAIETGQGELDFGEQSAKGKGQRAKGGRGK